MTEAKKPLKLISFLGKRLLPETIYDWNASEKKSSFATMACVDFLKPNKVILFLTKEAREACFERIKAELEAQGVLCETRDIPVGKDENELWDIFNALTDAVDEGEDVAMDVTNGLRSLPILALLTAVFMKSARSVNITHILYGAYDLGLEKTPIFDLSEMLNLLDWSIAADRFIRSGDSTDMAELLKERGEEIKKKSKYDKNVIDQVKPFLNTAKSLKAITDALVVLRPYHAMIEIAELDKNIKSIEKTRAFEKRMAPLYRLLEKIDRSYSELENPAPESGGADEIANTLEQERKLIFWYCDHGYWVQAISLAREWLVSWVMYREGELDFLDKDLRDDLTKRINLFTHDKAQWSGSDYISKHTDGKEFTDLWNEIVDIRNDIDHAGKNLQPKEADNLIKRAKEQFKILAKIKVRP